MRVSGEVKSRDEGRVLKKMTEEQALTYRVAALVVDALARDGVDAAILKRRDTDYAAVMLALGINGTRVPFAVREEWNGTFPRRRSRKFQAKIDSLRGLRDNLLDARSFRQARTRKDTEGFDIDKIAEHALRWAQMHSEYVERRRQMATLKGDWATWLHELKGKHGCPEWLKLRATPGGIELSGTVGGADLERILKAVGK